MVINEIRIYAEVFEQGLDFKNYICNTGFDGRIINIYTKKARGSFKAQDSLVDRIRKVKDVDVLITAIASGQEYPLLMIEYSTAVPTDDHKMQRSDVYYWSSVLRVPMLKISPADKGMEQSFGGGNRITDEQEQALAFNRGSVFYPIDWKSNLCADILITNKNALSCIPENKELADIISKILKTFRTSNDYTSFYNALIHEYAISYKETLSKVTAEEIKKNIVNSSRFHWYGNKLCVKINRFGHAMDPDRGVLYFANMLVGAQNTITEIQVNRSENPACRGGYNALFDALANKKSLLEYIASIIKNQGNVFNDENALNILTHGLNIEHALSFEKKCEHTYIIKDDVLKHFLSTHPSMVPKTIFFLSTQLILTDKNRKVICSIQWNIEPIQEYLSQVSSCNYTPTPIAPLTMQKAKEDIITFASVELYKKLHCDLLAVSYPGAQGDRCILTGSGRSVLRTYVDIIAYKRNDDGIEVFLEECKDEFARSPSDVDKLNDILKSSEKMEGLKLLFHKIIKQNDIKNVYTAVAAKHSKSLPRFLVDYIFMFSLSSDIGHTYIDYTIAVVNTKLIPMFLPLSNDGRLTGKLCYDKIFVINEQ